MNLTFVAEWLESLAPYRCGFESRCGLWVLSCDSEKAIQLAYGTWMILLRLRYCMKGYLRFSSTCESWKS